MKKLFKAVGIIAILAALVFSFAACDDLIGLIGNDKTNSNKTDDQTTVADTYKPVVYTSFDPEGTMYELKITRSSKAVKEFTPVIGDFFTLTITATSGVAQISTGQITNVYGTTYTLKHTSGDTYSVTVSADSSSSGTIVSITGDIPIDNSPVAMAAPIQLAPSLPTNKTPVASDYDIANLTQTEGSVTAVTITPKSGKSTGTITIKYSGSTTIPQTAGTYAVTFDVAAASGWNPATGLSAGTLTINAAPSTNQTPVASDYDIANLTQTAGSVTVVTITPKSGKSTGTITIKYSGSATIPQTAGTYAVTFDVAAASGWNAATGLSAGTLTINTASSTNQTPVASDYDIANLTQTAGSVTAVTITPKAGKSSGAITIKYAGSTTIPQTAGTYAVTFDVAAASGWNAATGLSAGTLTITLSGGGSNPPTTWTAIPKGTANGTSTTFGIEFINAIAYGGGKFVAVGDHGQMAYSSDGISWTAIPRVIGPRNDTNIYAIAYGSGKFVAGGRDYNNGIMTYSSDGVNWTTITDSTFTGPIDAIVYGGGKFVAVQGSNGGKMAYSSDGVNWTAVTDSTLKSIKAIAYGGGKFVASSSGNDSQMAYSSDGINWTVVTDSTFTGYIQAIAYGSGKFVAGGGDKMAYSSDGVNWTAVTDSTFTGYIQAIAYGGGRFVAGSQTGKMAYSSDGVNWTAVTDSTFGTSDNYIAGITYGNNRFVAVGGGNSGGKMAYSN